MTKITGIQRERTQRKRDNQREMRHSGTPSVFSFHMSCYISSNLSILHRLCVRAVLSLSPRRQAFLIRPPHQNPSRHRREGRQKTNIRADDHSQTLPDLSFHQADMTEEAPLNTANICQQLCLIRN